MNAIIIQNSRGGWSIYPPESSRAIGNYATESDAHNVALINGWGVVK